jgi:hypothetical protein
MSRLDGGKISQEDVRNTKTNSYMLNNYIQNCDKGCCEKGCNSSNMPCKKNHIEFATNQPGVFFKNGYGLGLGENTMDENTRLITGSRQLNNKTSYHFQQRSYATIPYLGRGSGNSFVESKLRNGELIGSNKMSETNMSEVSYIPYSMTPLLNELETSMLAPEHLIESVADSNWVRGGIATREMARDVDFSE